MASKRHRDFPILDKNGCYGVGIYYHGGNSGLGARVQECDTCDHNERSQAVDGMENANILEIIDHHRLGTVILNGDRYFSSGTSRWACILGYDYISEMHKEAGVTIENMIADWRCVQRHHLRYASFSAHRPGTPAGQRCGDEAEAIAD